MKIPVEDVDSTAAAEPEATEVEAEVLEPEVEDESAEAEQAAEDAPQMTEDEMVEAAIRAGEEAANDDFKVKYEAAKQKLAEVQGTVDAAEAKAKEAVERHTRLQADWENFRRRTANERLAEKSRATEKVITALLPIMDDLERAIDHARQQDMSEDFKQFVDGVDAVHSKLLNVFANEGVEVVDPKGQAFDPQHHQAVGRVEDASQYDETVNDVYQKGYRMGDKTLRTAMVTVTYGGEARPAEQADE